MILDKDANYIMIEKEDGNPGWSAQSYLKIVDDSLIVLGKKMVDEAINAFGQIIKTFSIK